MFLKQKTQKERYYYNLNKNKDEKKIVKKKLP